MVMMCRREREEREREEIRRQAEDKALALEMKYRVGGSEFHVRIFSGERAVAPSGGSLLRPLQGEGITGFENFQNFLVRFSATSSALMFGTDSTSGSIQTSRKGRIQELEGEHLPQVQRGSQLQYCLLDGTHSVVKG